MILRDLLIFSKLVLTSAILIIGVEETFLRMKFTLFLKKLFFTQNFEITYIILLKYVKTKRRKTYTYQKKTDFTKYF